MRNCGKGHIPSLQNISGTAAVSLLSPPLHWIRSATKPAMLNPAQHLVMGWSLVGKPCSPSSSKRSCFLMEKSEKSCVDAPEGEALGTSHCQESSRLPACGQTWWRTIEQRDLFSGLRKTSSRYALSLDVWCWQPHIKHVRFKPRLST